ncbi:MAG: hypothetical protein APF76_01950 [Desulfitibacter sp. BRH_c19]|nr:MAG: hypothetical protein APF76_01950 [Desulfitibacter sp. BRH_c19]
MYISIQDLGIFLVLSIVAVAGIFLIITLNKVNRILSEVKKTITNNNENIQKTIDNFTSTFENINEVTSSLRKNKQIFDESIPSTINNIHSISATLKSTTDKVDRSLDIVNISLIETASSVKENTQDIISYIKIISDAVRVLIQVLFTKK